ncbi:hypothetical protein DFJ58DRAFT_889959 [Suillus subalutaceus]|uniref:uncharacterized protein n=1 Tax=Suillus subalutaceus TaxID=48586 RepID=UPI001B861A8B|nr:uncharacterized protein DFJ58DRAFT_889959 [Suillus subalutaceus]KAG1848491.1 hypothetical protein DFJ58DRAFT_889959 [Suillus subalutaceus]
MLGIGLDIEDWDLQDRITAKKAINIMWFANRNDEGIIYYTYFNPIPTEVVALVLTAMSHIPSSVALTSGLKVSRKISNSHQLPTVLSTKVILASLQHFQQHTAPYKLLEKICDNLHDTARFHAGVEPLAMILAAPHRINNNAFEDAIREYQLEEQDNVEDNES